jgi:hypothetical protein
MTAAKPVLEVKDEGCGRDAVKPLQGAVHKFGYPAALTLDNNRVMRGQV